MAQSNGGVATTSRLTLYPMLNVTTGVNGFFSFDPANGYNDPNASSFYNFKVEEVLPGRTPTITRVIVTYRDLGLVTVVFLLFGTQDNNLVGGILGDRSMQTVQLGNAVATGKLMTKFVDMGITAQNIQLQVVRAAGAGALSIVKVTMCGKVETEQTF